MQLVKKKHANKFVASPETTIFEYLMTDKDISGAVAKINGRYPEKRLAVNEVSKELAYIISGKGYIITKQTKQGIQSGDVIFIQPQEQFAWEGKLTLFITTTPKFRTEQHTVIDK